MALDRASTPEVVIRQLDLPDSCALRLKAMGLFEGQRVEIARWGNPLVVKAAGSKIALAREIARHILVGPATSSASSEEASPADSPASEPRPSVATPADFDPQPTRRTTGAGSAASTSFPSSTAPSHSRS